MKITGLLKKEGVKLGVVAASQDEAIDVLVDLQCGIGAVADRDRYKQAVLAREAEFSTAVGEGVAVGSGEGVKTGAVAVAASGVNSGASTWERAEKLIGLAAPEFRDGLIKAAEEQRIWRRSNKL